MLFFMHHFVTSPINHLGNIAFLNCVDLPNTVGPQFSNLIHSGKLFEKQFVRKQSPLPPERYMIDHTGISMRGLLGRESGHEFLFNNWDNFCINSLVENQIVQGPRCSRTEVWLSTHFVLNIKITLWNITTDIIRKVCLSERFYLFIFRQRGRQGEKHQCVVASHAPPTGDLACNPGMCPDWESVTLCFSGWSSIHWRHKPGQKSLFKCWEVWQQIVFRKLKNIFLKTQILYWQRRLSVYLEVTGSVTSYILEKNFCQMSKSVFKNKQQKNRR